MNYTDFDQQLKSEFVSLGLKLLIKMVDKVKVVCANYQTNTNTHTHTQLLWL